MGPVRRARYPVTSPGATQSPLSRARRRLLRSRRRARSPRRQGGRWSRQRAERATTSKAMPRPKKEYGVVARLPKWSTKEWSAWRRGVESGQVIGRHEGREEAAASQPRFDRVLREREVRHLTGLSRTARWSLVKRGQFPSAVPLTEGGRATGWRESEVRRWVASRRARDTS